jgi:hypothetical protein
MTPPFHQLTTKKEGDRVKILRHPADESRGWYYGTVFHQALTDSLRVRWDEDIPFCSKVTDINIAIIV